MCNNQINLKFLYIRIIYVNIKCIYVIYNFFLSYWIPLMLDRKLHKHQTGLTLVSLCRALILTVTTLLHHSWFRLCVVNDFILLNWIQCFKCMQDNWKEVLIGCDVVLCCSRACLRCMYITIDYDKQQLRPTKEPQSTLMKYESLRCEWLNGCGMNDIKF